MRPKTACTRKRRSCAGASGSDPGGWTAERAEPPAGVLGPKRSPQLPVRLRGLVSTRLSRLAGALLIPGREWPVRTAVPIVDSQRETAFRMGGGHMPATPPCQSGDRRDADPASGAWPSATHMHHLGGLSSGCRSGCQSGTGAASGPNRGDQQIRLGGICSDTAWAISAAGRALAIGGDRGGGRARV